MLKKIFNKFNQLEFLHVLVGLPSYDKYLEYHKKFHSHCKPKTRKEFFLEAQENRYGSNGTKKCC